MRKKTSFSMDEEIWTQVRQASAQWAKREREEASPDRMMSAWITLVLKGAATAELARMDREA